MNKTILSILFFIFPFSCIGGLDVRSFKKLIFLQRLEIYCVPNIVTTISALSPEKLHSNYTFKLEWIRVPAGNPVVKDLVFLMDSARETKRRSFDARWYIFALGSGGERCELYTSGIDGYALINGTAFLLDESVLKRLLDHFSAFQNLILGNNIK